MRATVQSEARVLRLLPWIGVLAAAVSCAKLDSSGQVTSVRGIQMYYQVHGRGSPLVLLHGGAGNGKQFEKQVADFERTHRVIIPDLCAQGRTTDRSGPLSYHEMAEDVVALLDALHQPHVDVMGWSDGGNVGIDIAIHHPDRLGHLVTFGANFSPEGLNDADLAWSRTATADSFGTDAEAGYRALSPTPDHYREAMTKILEMWRTEPRFTPAELGSIRAKTLICAGEHDVIRPEHTEQLARMIPGASTWIVPGASHSAMIERPDLVNPRVLEFLKS